jgi:hypothetical protein
VHPDEAFIAPVQVDAVKESSNEDLIKQAVEAAVKAALEAVKQ